MFFILNCAEHPAHARAKVKKKIMRVRYVILGHHYGMKIPKDMKCREFKGLVRSNVTRIDSRATMKTKY